MVLLTYIQDCAFYSQLTTEGHYFFESNILFPKREISDPDTTIYRKSLQSDTVRNFRYLIPLPEIG